MERWTEDLGVIIRPTPGASALSDLEVGEVIATLRTHGVVLFRGFSKGDLEAFAAFTEAFAVPFLMHGGRAHQPLEGVAPNIRMVTSGTEAVGLHSEVSGLPVRPDYLWLHCLEPAQVGGDTVLADGVKLWRALPDPVRELFQQRWLQYSSGPRGIGPREWQAAFETEDVEQAEARIEAFRARLDDRFERMVLEREGDRFVGHYAIRAMVPGHLHPEPAFANALFGPYRVFPTFDDGKEVPDELLGLIGETMGPLCRRLAWEAGDVVMVDNWRVLHGRLPFLGRRQIVTRMGGTRCDFPLFSGGG